MCRVQLKTIINVHDCGNLINPQLAEAQVHGGMSMAIGFGLSEELKFDQKTGKPIKKEPKDELAALKKENANLKKEVQKLTEQLTAKPE